jgi:kinesin family protein 3/17
MPKKSEAIKVVFRVRPLNSKEKQVGCGIATVAHEDKGVIEISSPDGGLDSTKTFTFDAVFSQKSSQRHIYDVCAAPVVQSVLEGFNGTVFCYGQTGAGKVSTGGNATDVSYRVAIPLNCSTYYIPLLDPHNGRTQRT